MNETGTWQFESCDFVRIRARFDTLASFIMQSAVRSLFSFRDELAGCITRPKASVVLCVFHQGEPIMRSIVSPCVLALCVTAGLFTRASRLEAGNAETSSARSAPVLLRFVVPTNAEIWFDGVKTSQSGSAREFVSPALTPGHQYSYQVRVRWMNGDQPVEETRRLSVRAGDDVTVEMGRSRVGNTVSYSTSPRTTETRTSFYEAPGGVAPTYNSGYSSWSDSDSTPEFTPGADWGIPARLDYEPADPADYDLWSSSLGG